ncbi:MAG TPA: ABC transporter permease subunit, partial [Verrucomicrobiae bacterium]|nr:ABC transporter permease subunit [Verrucomicrobiae bacterium]
MKKHLSLILGGLIILAIVVVMVFPGLITQVNPYGTQSMKTWVENGKFNMEGPPYPPSATAPLGTDDLGRDILAFIAYGTRLTITLGFLVVVGRYLLALPLGLLAGFGSYVARTAINQFNVIFSAIPALIISIIVLKMDFFLALDKQYSIIAFVFVLSMAGWAKLGAIIMERVNDILSQPFIRSERAIGKGQLRIAVENVLPHLAPELVVLFFMEIAGALNMIMQLGVFGVFVGNLRFIADTQGGVVTFLNLSFEPEWASMLSTSRKYILTAPWMVLFPASAFFISILGFNLIGEGLRARLQARDSRFGIYVRRLLMLDKTLFTSLIRNRWIRQGLVLGLVLCILTLSFSTYLGHSRKFDTNDVSFAPPQQNGVVIGSGEAQATAREISQALQEYGYQPVKGQDFVVQYETQGVYLSAASRLALANISQADKTLVEGKDYSLASFGELNLRGEVLDCRSLDLFAADANQFRDKFVLLDGTIYTASAVKFLENRLMREAGVKGVFAVVKGNLPSSVGNEVYDGVLGWITPETADLLAGNTIKFSLQSKKLPGIGRNVLGVLPGADSKLNKEVIIVGLGYNYLPGEAEIGRERIRFGLELARKLAAEKHNRKIVVAFWDGSINDSFNGINSFAKDTVFSPQDIQLYLDLSRINSLHMEQVLYNSTQASVTGTFAWGFGNQLERNLREQNYPIQVYDGVRRAEEVLETSPNIDEAMYFKGGIATILAGTGGGHATGKISL